MWLKNAFESWRRTQQFSARRRVNGPSTVVRSRRPRLEPLEQRHLLAAVPTLFLDPGADTGRSDSDNVVSSLDPSSFEMDGGMSMFGMSFMVIEGPMLLEDGQPITLFMEGRHAYTAQMVIRQIQPVAGMGGGFDPNQPAYIDTLHSSDALIVTIDSTDPDAPTISIDPAGSDTGVPGYPATIVDRVTSDTTPGFVGTAEGNAIVRVAADGVPQGMTLAGPYGCTDALDNASWQLAGAVDLNDPNHFPLDGLRRITVTAEDLAGNVSDAGSFDIFIDTQGPRVSDVFITSDPNYDLFDPKPSAFSPTPLVNQISIAVEDLPNRSAPDFLYDALQAGVATSAGHYLLKGDCNGVIPIQNVPSYPARRLTASPATGTIVLTFAEPLSDDRFTLTVSDALVDPAGNRLDGESNVIQPSDNPTLPTGDGTGGGDFVARFTVDSRPEIGTWAAGGVFVDTNGNFQFDPRNADFTNRDIAYALAYTSDNVFAGNFAANPLDYTDPMVAADDFDKLAAYGLVGEQYRWLIDTDNDGVPEHFIDGDDPANINGLPVAGRFDDFDSNGDEVGLFTGSVWHFDTDHDFKVDYELPSELQGFPIVGDFDGDGFDDLGTWINDVFTFDLTGGVRRGWDGQIDATIGFGFIGARERPVTADMDQDGIDDIGLWIPDRYGVELTESAEWHFLVSDDRGRDFRQPGTVATLDHPFTPKPFGKDIFTQYGDEFAAPVVGNFDPPVTVAASSSDAQALGSVALVELADLDPSSGDLWYRGEASRRGLLTVEAVAAGSAAVTLYDANIDTLAGLSLAGDSQRVDLQVEAGQTFYVKVAGGAADVDLRLVNLVTQDGSRLFVGGTDAADQFEFQAASPRHLTINGTRYDLEARVKLIAFKGGAGSDTAVLDGAEDGERAELWPDYGFLRGESRTVTAAAESITVTCGGAGGVAKLYGSDAPDTFVGTTSYGKLLGEGYENRAYGFRYVHATSTGDGDVAKLHASPEKDTLVSTPDYAKLSSQQYYIRANGFRHVYATGTSGGNDVAKMYDSAGQDTLISSPTSVKLHGDEYFVRAKNFRYVHATSTAGGQDVAKMYDSAGQDTFDYSPTQAKLYGDGFYVRAKGFRYVYAGGRSGDGDVANLGGSTGSDTFVAMPDYAKLSGDDYFVRVKRFDEVHANAVRGSGDEAQLHGSMGDDNLIARDNWAQLADAAHSYLLSVERFDQVEANAVPPGETQPPDANDTVDAAAELAFDLVLNDIWD